MKIKINDRDEPNTDRYLVMLIKDATGERYQVMFDVRTKYAAMDVLQRWASDPTLSFNWNDAARLTCQVQALTKHK